MKDDQKNSVEDRFSNENILEILVLGFVLAIVSFLFIKIMFF